MKQKMFVYLAVFGLIFILFLPNINVNAQPYYTDTQHYYNADLTDSDSLMQDYNGSSDFYIYNGLKYPTSLNNSVYLPDGQNNYMYSSTDYNLTSHDWTMSFFANITYTTNLQISTIIGQYKLNNFYSWQLNMLYYHSLKFTWWDSAGVHYSPISDNRITYNEWYYYTITYNVTLHHINIYVNNQLFLSFDVTLKTNNFPINIAGYQYSPELYFDELSVYNYTFTQSQINTQYDYYKNNFQVITSNNHNSNVMSFDLLNMSDFIYLGIIMSVLGSVFEISNRKNN